MDRMTISLPSIMNVKVLFLITSVHENKIVVYQRIKTQILSIQEIFQSLIPAMI